MRSNKKGRRGGNAPDYLKTGKRAKACTVVPVQRGVLRNPFPPQLRTTLTFAQSTVQAISAASQFSVRTFRANGPYDPDETGTGYQPKYYSTLLGADNSLIPYSSYVVKNATLSLRCKTLVEDVGAIGEVIIYARDANRSQITIDEVFREMPNSIVRAIGLPNSPQGLVEMAMKVDISALLGVDDVLDVSVLKSAYNTIPSKRAAFDVAVKMAATSGSEVDYEFDVRIDYDLYCLDLNTAATDTSLRVRTQKVHSPGEVATAAHGCACANCLHG